MARVFISHSSRDNEPAARIKSWLQAQGFETPFLDFDKHAGIPPGSDWEKTLYREIELAEAVIIIQTPNWLDSKWCFAEFTQARALGKAIFPIIETPTGDTLIAPDIQALDLRKDREGGLEQLARALTAIALDAQAGFSWDASRPPYPGLLAFQEEDAAIYFGRDDDIRRVIERLNARRAQGGAKLIALLGASGSGKSSLLRAGVIPRLKRDTRNWIILPTMRPQRRPIDELAQSFAVAIGEEADWRTLRDDLREGEAAQILGGLARDLRVKRGANEAHILLPIDQAEELFGAADPDDSKRFLEILSGALFENLPFLAIMAQRSDYLEALQSAESLTAKFEEVSLAPLPLSRVPQIIEGPARVAGLAIEDVLVAKASADAATEDALPLLAFALRQLYDRFGADNHLSLNDYVSLGDLKEGLSPLENAVRTAADKVIADFQPSEDQLEALREAFVPAMVRVNDQGDYVRRPAAWDELPPKSHALIEDLAKARLLVLGAAGEMRIVEVAHEALLRKWPRLRNWLDDEREFLIGQQQLQRDLHDWQAASEADKAGALLTGLKLTRSRTWLAERPQLLSSSERSFIQESISRRVRLKRTIILAGVAASLALLFFGFRAYQAQQQAATAATRLVASQWVALSQMELLSGDTAAALSMAVAGLEVDATLETRSATVTALVEVSPYLTAVIEWDPDVTRAFTWRDTDDVAFATWTGELFSVSAHGLPADDPINGLIAETPRRSATDPYVVATTNAAGGHLLTVLSDGRLLIEGRSDPVMPTMPLNVYPVRHGVDASADGTHIAIVTFQDLILVWSCFQPEPDEWECSDTASVQADGARAVAMSPDGARIAVADRTGHVTLSDLSGNILSRVPENEETDGVVYTALDWSETSNLLAASTTNGRIDILDIDEGLRLVDSFAPQSEPYAEIRWSPTDDTLAYTCNDIDICLIGKNWRESSETRFSAQLAGHPLTVGGIDWSRDGSRLASLSDDGTLRIWSLNQNQGALYRLGSASGQTFRSVVADPGSDRIAGGNANGEVWVWAGHSDPPIRLPLPEGLAGPVVSLSWNERGHLLAVYENAGIAIWDVLQESVVRRELFSDGLSFSRAAWLDDGLSAAVPLSDARIAVVPAASRLPMEYVSVGIQIPMWGVTAIPGQDGAFISLGDGSICQWALGSSECSQLVPPAGPGSTTPGARSLAVSPTDEWFAATADDHSVHLHTMRVFEGTSELGTAATLEVDAKDTIAVAFSTDGTRIAALDSQGFLYVWNLNAEPELWLAVPATPIGAAGNNVRRGAHWLTWLADGSLALATQSDGIQILVLDEDRWKARAAALSVD